MNEVFEQSKQQEVERKKFLWKLHGRKSGKRKKYKFWKILSFFAFENAGEVWFFFSFDLVVSLYFSPFCWKIDKFLIFPFSSEITERVEKEKSISFLKID